MAEQLPIPRTTVDALVNQRNRALELFNTAYDSLIVAQEAFSEARKAATRNSNGLNSYTYATDREKHKFMAELKIADREDFKANARRMTDIDVWSHVIQITNLERLMDKKAKDELRKQLADDPPEVTHDNIYATVQRFMLDSDTIFRRGIAECFSNLDRRFRSHDGWKIGSRVILTNAFNDWGSWNYNRNHEDSLIDIERTFRILDGDVRAKDYCQITGKIREARDIGSGVRRDEVDTDYFKVRIYKNGNAHVWFKRDDLLEKVNKLLGEYYGEVIPEEREPDKDTGFDRPKTAVAKNYGFFPTPDTAAKRLMDECPMYRREDEPQLAVLEPSAGTGNLAKLAVESGAIVDCVEIQPHLVDALRTHGIYRKVYHMDFLSLQHNPVYDRVIMNPPFDRERDIDHVLHALKFLKPNGYLAAIMSAGTEFRETKKSKAFRSMMEKMNARWRDLPSGSFSSVGTHVNTIILRVYKDGTKFW